MRADGSFVSDVLGPSVVTGVGFGLCLAPGVAVATAGVAAGEIGMASGLLNSARQIGASLGLAALGTAASDRSGRGAVGAVALDLGYGLGMGICAVILGVAAVVAFVVLPRTGPVNALEQLEHLGPAQTTPPDATPTTTDPAQATA
jgi:hypothetical protein